MTNDADLRAWASGLLTLEAATEMLIRAGYAGAGSPWVQVSDGRTWINFAGLPGALSGLSGGEARFLRIAASVAGSEAVVLGDVITGLDPRRIDLVLAALAHVAGIDGGLWPRL